MRIAMVSEHANPLATVGGVDAGGQNLHVGELSKALARQGHQVRIYSRRENAEVPDVVELAPGVEVEHVPAGPHRPLPKDALLPLMPEFAEHLTHRWQHQVPDVVHAHFWMSGLAAQIATWGLDVPVVQTFHALGSVKRRHQGAGDTSPAERVEVERSLASSVAAVIATCSDEVFELAAMGVRPGMMAVVPCGVDLARFVPEGDRTPRRHLHRILSVGRLVERKGFDLLITALRAVPDTELVIAGGPPAGPALDADPEATWLRTLAARLGLADRVVLLGAVTPADMPALLRSADVVACTPWYEPFGIVAVEAMACGAPVVASAVGGFTDTIIDGVTGVLVPPRAPETLAVALRQLLASPQQRATLGRAAAARARARYGWDRIAGQTAGVYGDVAAPSRAVAAMGAR